MLHKAKTVAYSGLYDKTHLLATGVDYITLNQLMKFSRIESDQQRSSGYSNFIWTDMISAVMHETPKLRNHVKLMEFREKLMKHLEEEMSRYLSKPNSVRSDNSPMKILPTTSTSGLLPTVDQIKKDPEKLEMIEEETSETVEEDQVLVPDIEMVEGIAKKEELTTNFNSTQDDNAEGIYTFFKMNFGTQRPRIDLDKISLNVITIKLFLY